MEERRGVFDVLLAGYFGFGNLGDELLALSAVNNLEACGISREKMAILSNNPYDSQNRLGIKAFDRWKITSILRALSSSRSLLLSGGGIFQDSTSIRSCAYYWGIVRAARSKSVPVAALGQSVGPLSRSLSKLFARDAFSRCKYIAVRDALSSEILSNMRITSELMPDMVFGLPFPEQGTERGGAVLINIRPVRGESEDVRAVLEAARQCASGGMELLCAAMSEEDADTMKRFQESGELPGCDIITVSDMEGFSRIASRASSAIGMRLHFGILSILAGLDVVLAPYDPKVACFAHDYGVELLKFEEVNENFDIIKLLTNSRFRYKRKFEKFRLLVIGQFHAALNRLLGDEDGRCKTRRA
jgi:polysaccharide pyruvyl transferase CsaB